MTSDWVGISGTRYKTHRPRGLAPWNPQERLAAVLNDVADRLDAERDYWPLTGRHEGYQLVEHKGYEKEDEATFDDAEYVILRGRRAGMIPWEAIDDGRSDESSLPTWETTGEFLEAAPGWYSQDLLSDQDTAIEIFVEAAGMVSQSSAVAHRFTIPVLTSSGYRTTSAVHALALRALTRFRKEGRSTTGLLVGDLDSDGLSAIDSTADDAWAFVADMSSAALAEQVLRFEIVALTPEQVDAYDIETKPGNKIIRRGDYRGPAVQLEALDAPDFAEILTGAIEDRIDLDLYAAQVAKRARRQDRIDRQIKRGAR